jgi:uncharacterized membrane protein YjgN (DUF898 family)
VNQMSWTPLGPPSPPALPPPLPVPVTFSGDRGEFFRLLRRGAALEFVTLGFYRFWLVTDTRRHLWSNTQVDGDAAEYTGRGKELLIGFLFALAILVPIYLLYFLAGLEAEHYRAFASFPLIAFFYLFGQFAIYRARRYRLTRTVWRGVRFWMDGSGWSYAGRATLWGLLTVLTLGLALPWRDAALERYKMRHSWYGDLQGSFEGEAWEFLRLGWWLWLLAPLAIILFPLAPFFYSEFKAVQWRWWLSGIRFGGVQVESTLRRGALHGLYWKVIGWALLLSTVFSLYVFGCTMVVANLSGATFEQSIQPNGVSQSVPVLILTAIGYLGVALGLGVVTRLYLMRDVWVRVLASTTVSNIAAAANVSSRGTPASALGEGFADGLDVAGF